MPDIGGFAEDIFEVAGSSWLSKALVGAGVVVAAPLLFPQLRPAAKSVLKGGMAVGDNMRELFAEAREQWSDLSAEAKAELKAQQEASAEASSSDE
jgi:hypothetical protein